MNLPNAFTVDVEDYFQVSGFADNIRPDCWDDYESRVEASTHRLLRLLAGHQVQATFFVLGWVADRFPALVRDIHSDGHELASHGYWHRLIYNQSPAEFAADVKRSKAAIAGACGVEVDAYRAPSFSITSRSEWALDVLIQEGFRIDSSVFPIRHDRYGMPGANPAPHCIQRPAGSLWEVPPSITNVGLLNIPAAGGGYFRFFPERLSQTLQNRVIRRNERPLVFYIHPWEVDPDQPRLPGRRSSKFRHYCNLHRTEGRLSRMLTRLPFGTLGQLVAAAESRSSHSQTAAVAP